MFLIPLDANQTSHFDRMSQYAPLIRSIDRHSALVGTGAASAQCAAATERLPLIPPLPRRMGRQDYRHQFRLARESRNEVLIPANENVKHPNTWPALTKRASTHLVRAGLRQQPLIGQMHEPEVHESFRDQGKQGGL